MDKRYSLVNNNKVSFINNSLFYYIYISENYIEIETFMGNLYFKPEDIISIEKYCLIPKIYEGIKINHRIESYPSFVVFRSFRNPKIVMNAIENSGFLSKINSNIDQNDLKIFKKQKEFIFPFKTKAWITVYILFNILVGFDLFIWFFKDNYPQLENGIGIILSLLMIVFILTLTLAYPKFRNYIFKEGSNIEDFKIVFTYFIITYFALSMFFLYIKCINI